MKRFVGIKNGYIHIISDKLFLTEGIETVELPDSLQNISDINLISDYRFHNGEFSYKFAKKSIKDMKIALVGNWKMQCGIATYSENLWGQISNYLNDFKLFIEKNDSPTGPLNEIGNKVISPEQIVSCWKRGESLQNLVSEIKNYNPDIIWIQHEFGLWPNAGYWLSLLNQLSDFRIIVTMHSVFHHKDKTICEAAIPEIVTHLEGGYNILKNEKQIPGKVYVIPHGCSPCADKNKLWNFYKSDKTFVQFGFGFRYKGWENCLYATAILKQKYSDVFFTGLFSESSFNKIEHQTYYNELMNLVNDLSIQENVAIIRGFQSDYTIDSYLRTNQATIFPYVSHPSHEVFGASGAARLAMSKALPVITSSVNHFSDLPTIKANTPEEMAEMLERCFVDKSFKEDQINKQLKFINENSWEIVAHRYISLFENYDNS
jgi:glycosyltransferase involved in cell wall biosynthesis